MKRVILAISCAALLQSYCAAAEDAAPAKDIDTQAIEQVQNVPAEVGCDLSLGACEKAAKVKQAFGNLFNKVTRAKDAVVKKVEDARQCPNPDEGCLQPVEEAGQTTATPVVAKPVTTTAPAVAAASVDVADDPKCARQWTPLLPGQWTVQGDQPARENWTLTITPIKASEESIVWKVEEAYSGTSEGEVKRVLATRSHLTNYESVYVLSERQSREMCGFADGNMIYFDERSERLYWTDREVYFAR